ncbi:MAG TPA: glycosyltransferase [Sedimentisphaerales bacterium]|nr:glycosyltransferase [Sedimentisphaerales bacterium]
MRKIVVHLIHSPVSAERFVQPLVKCLNSNGVQTELWFENWPELEYFISAIDCPKRFVRFDLSINPFTVLTRCIGLLKRFLKCRPLAIHAHQTRAAFIPLLTALIAHVPTRVYCNGGTPYLGYWGPLRGLLWLLEYLNCCFATHVITVSPSIRKKMIQHRIVRESKCEVLGKGSSCGIDLDEFSAEQFDKEHMLKSRQALEIAPDAYVVLYVGRPFKRKGFHTMLRAWKNMSHDGNNEDILLIAGCSDKDVINVTKTTIKNVVALGYVKDLRFCYAACDIVVLPSWHEGFPYSLLEGAAAGRPLVGSDILGIDSIIIKNKNGLLVPLGDTKALAEALVTLKSNPGLRENMGESGRQYIEQHFNRKVFSSLFLDYYDRIGIKKHLTNPAK